MELEENKNEEKINPIEDYLNTNSSSTENLELWEAKEKEIDLKTELTKDEIVVANVIRLNANFLKEKGLDNNIFEEFLQNYTRLRVSLDRKSRIEFVTVNKKNQFDDNIKNIADLKSISDVKK